MAAIQHPAVNNAAPIRFIEETRYSASTEPTCPPAGIPPVTGCQAGTNPNAVQVAERNIPAPKTFAHWASIGAERIHIQPSSRINTGTAYAPKPSVCRRKSAKNAPTRPVRLTGLAAPVTVFHEGSSGWYDTRPKKMNSPAIRNRIATASLSRGYCVGPKYFIRRQSGRTQERLLLCQKRCGTQRRPQTSVA